MKFQDGHLSLVPVYGYEGDTPVEDPMKVPEPDTLVSLKVHVAEDLYEQPVLFAKEWKDFPIMRPEWQGRK
eukprot:3349354-Amphidinium_carterae.1